MTGQTVMGMHFGNGYSPQPGAWRMCSLLSAQESLESSMGRSGGSRNLTQRMQLHDYNIVVEAAVAGQGIAMGRHRLIFRQLASNALVQAPPETILDGPRTGWWLVNLKRSLGDVASLFRDWLTQDAAQDPSDCMDQSGSSAEPEKLTNRATVDSIAWESPCFDRIHRT